MTALLLTDSTMPVSFSKAGPRSAHAMAKYLGERVYMVSDVYVELQRLAQRLPALARLLRSWPPNPVLELDLGLRAEVAAAIKARQLPGRHPGEDRGEVATVFYAVSRRAAGERFDVVTDDGYGKRLARDRGLRLTTTAEIALAMVHADALSRGDGKRVWRQCVSRSRWDEFESALAERAPSV